MGGAQGAEPHHGGQGGHDHCPAGQPHGLPDIFTFSVAVNDMDPVVDPDAEDQGDCHGIGRVEVYSQ